MDELLEEFGAWINIRLKNDDTLTLKKTQEMLGDTKYIISEEGDGENIIYHQHIVWVTDKSIEEVRAVIKEYYPEIKGNKCLYIKECRDKKQSAKYTVKEGKFTSNKFSTAYIDRIVKTSNKKENMNKKFVQLDDLYITKEINKYEYLERRMILKSQHDQSIYINHERAYFYKMQIKRDEKNAKEMVSMILNE